MTRLDRPLLLAASLLAAPAPLAAQDARAEVLAAVQTVFDAMRTHDSTALREVFEPGARLVTVGRRNGEARVRTAPVDDFVRAVGSATIPWNESIRDPEVRIDGDLATVWGYYEFFAGDTFSHCGYDAFHLARIGGRWKIVALADTQRTEGCAGR